MSTDRRASRFHLAAMTIFVMLLGPARGDEPAKTDATTNQSADFRGKLHDFAIAKAGARQPGYFAIVRRGLDQYDGAVPQLGSRKASLQVNITALDASPDTIDLDPRGQVITSLRLGIRPDVNERIVGGFILGKGQYDEAVMLTGNDLLCSGVALDQSTVLTAAHCACDMHLAQSDNAFQDGNKKIVIGLGNTVDAKSGPIDLDATRFISKDLFGESPCPDIRPGLQAGRPDLALVRAKAGFAIDAPHLKIATSEVFEASIGASVFYVIGFGCTKPIQPTGRFLNCDSGSSGAKFAARINTSAQCSNPDPPDGCAPSSKEFSLRDSDLKADTCAGDSGGPVVLFARNAFFLAGITSRALDPNGACAKGGIYEKISTPEVIEWLKKSVSVDQ